VEHDIRGSFTEGTREQRLAEITRTRGNQKGSIGIGETGKRGSKPPYKPSSVRGMEVWKVGGAEN